MLALAATIVLALALAALPAIALGAIVTERVSVATGGGQGGGNSSTNSLALSADGRYIAFVSSSSTLVAGDTNGKKDIFLRDRKLSTTERVSIATGGGQAGGSSYAPVVSSDGRYVAFMSEATTLVAGDTNGTWDIFVRDRRLGTTERVSVATGGGQAGDRSHGPSISADGRYVAFWSKATTLVAGDTNSAFDIFVRDRQLGRTERVSVSTGGVQGDLDSEVPWISADGRFVAFMSEAATLIGGDTNGAVDIFVRDRQLGTTERVSVATGGGQAGDRSYGPSISANGRYVTFESYATTLVAGDTNGKRDVFLRDRTLGRTERISVSTGGGQVGDESFSAVVSADGRYASFISKATTLVAGDTNAAYDVFLRDRFANITERVSVSTGGGQSDAESGVESDSPVSANGRFVAFHSMATNLVAGDTNATWDVFVVDRGQRALSIARSPSKSSLTYRRKKGVAKYKLSARVRDDRGVKDRRQANLPADEQERQDEVEEHLQAHDAARPATPPRASRFGPGARATTAGTCRPTAHT